MRKTIQSITRITVLVGSVIGSFLLFCGCTTGPKYTYTKQPDSALIKGFSAPNQGPQDGSCHITIIRVDGFAVNFLASNPGHNWPFHEPELYLAYGTHTLDLDISEIDVVYGAHSENSAGIIGAYTAGTKPAVTVELAAAHTYRFTANLVGSKIDLVLWDETNGRASRSSIANWSFDSNKAYSE